MWRIVVAVTGLVLFNVFGFAQYNQKINDLKTTISNSDNDTTTIQALLQLSEQYQKTYKELAIDNAARALIIAKTSELQELECSALKQLGLIEYYQGNFAKSREYFGQMHKLSVKLNNQKNIANALNNLGVTYYEQGKLDQALEHYLEALNIRRSANLEADISVSYNNIGNIYKDLKDFHKAIEFYERSLEIKERLNDDFGIAMTINNIGLVNLDMKNYAKAISLFERAIFMERSTGNSYGEAMSINNLGMVYEALGELKSALKKYETAVQTREDIGDKNGIVQSKLSMGSVYMKMNKTDEAIKLLEEAIWLAKGIKVHTAIRDGYRNLFELYEKKGDFQSALDYHKAYAAYEDSIMNFESLKLTKELDAEFHASEKDKQIAELTQKIEENPPFWKSNWFFVVLFFGIIGVVIFLLVRFSKADDIEIVEEEKLYVTTARMLLATGVLFHPLVGLLFNSILPDAYDPILLRLSISAITLVALLGTFYANKIITHLTSITVFVYYISSIHAFYLVYKNNLAPEYLLLIPVVIGIVSAIFNKKIGTFIYSATFLIISIVVGFMTVEPEITLPIYFTIIFVSLLISIVVSIARISSNEQLAFSHNIIKQVDALVMVSNAKGKPIYVGDTVEKILGISANSILKNGWWNIVGITEEEAQKVEEKVARIAEGTEEPRKFYHTKIKNGNGETRWVQWRDRRIDGDMVLGIGHDVTEKKKTEDEIKRLSLVASKTDNYVIISDKNDVIQWVNKGFEKILGFTYDEVVGRKVSTVLANDQTQRDVVKKIVQTLFVNKQAYEGELAEITKNGEKKWLALNITPVLDKNGEIEQIISLGNDITEKKKHEEFLKSLTDKLQLVHDIEVSLLNADNTYDIIYMVLNQLINKMSINRASLILFDHEKDIFYTYSNTTGVNSQLKDGKEIPLKHFGGLQHLKEHGTRIVHDIKKLEKISSSDFILLEEGVNAYIMCPLVKEDELIGSLNLSFANGKDITQNTIELTEEVAKGLGVALVQSQLKDEIAQSNKELTEINGHITSSIKYAKMIQHAHLPDKDLLGKQGIENFILFRPRDIVSGDFYWLDRKNDWTIIAAADCTGHGVPGAFMTMVGMNQLNNIIHEKGITDPGMILTYLHVGILNALQTSDNQRIDDGMDIGICAINKTEGQMLFAGARRPLCKVTNGEMELIHPTKLSIGEQSELLGFETLEIDYKKDDCFYIFSDGYTDQFGGERGRKFSSKQLLANLTKYSTLHMTEQSKFHNVELDNWQGNRQQIDDILLIGFKI